MSKLWVPERGKLASAVAWLPRRFREERAGTPVRRPSRSQIRAFLQRSHSRADGTRHSQVPLAMRRATNRRRNRAARHARRENR